MEIEYTQEEYDQFRDLVFASKSQDLMDRIRARIDFHDFIKRVGKEKCDAMFKVLCEEDK